MGRWSACISPRVIPSASARCSHSVQLLVRILIRAPAGRCNARLCRLPNPLEIRKRASRFPPQPIAPRARRLSQGGRPGRGHSQPIPRIPGARIMKNAFSTRAVRAGIDSDTAFGAVAPPLILSANFSFDGFGGKRRYDYSRSGNPTRDQLGDALTSLEGGAGAVVTATGMAAVALVLHTLLEPSDRLLVPHDCYGGSWRLFTALAAKSALA